MSAAVGVFPPSIEKLGPSLWMVLHTSAAAYPDSNPSFSDKMKFRSLLHRVIDLLPDGQCECKTHAKMYILEHPVKVQNGFELRKWVCDFHNSVNARKGKPLHDCAIVASQRRGVCTTCDTDKSNIEPLPENLIQAISQVDNTSLESPKQTLPAKRESVEDNVVAGEVSGDGQPSSLMTQDFPDVHSALSQLKKDTIYLFDQLCKEYKVPKPKHHVFQPCPTQPSTSCTRVDFKGGGIEDSTIFWNPLQLRLVTIPHEFMHYYYSVQGDLDKAKNEELVEQKANEIIKEKFPYDATLNDKHISEEGYRKYIEYDDDDEKITMTDKGNKSNNNIVDGTFSSIHNLSDNEGGFMSSLDHAYSFGTEIFGVEAKELNNAHTPEIIGNLTVAALEYAFNPLGAISASMLTGLGLLGLNVIMKHDIGHRDRVLLQEVAGHFFWNGARYLNPKLSSQVIANAGTVGSLAGAGDFMGAAKSLLASSSVSTADRSRNIPIGEPVEGELEHEMMEDNREIQEPAHLAYSSSDTIIGNTSGSGDGGNILTEETYIDDNYVGPSTSSSSIMKIYSPDDGNEADYGISTGY